MTLSDWEKNMIKEISIPFPNGGDRNILASEPSDHDIPNATIIFLEEHLPPLEDDLGLDLFELWE